MDEQGSMRRRASCALDARSSSARGSIALLIIALAAADPGCHDVAGDPAAAEPDESGELERAAQREPVIELELQRAAPDSARASMMLSALLSGGAQATNASSSSCSFALADLRDLEIEASWSGVGQGAHLSRIEVRAPSGHLYQVLEVPFSMQPGALRARWPGGPPHAVTVQRTASRAVVPGSQAAKVSRVSHVLPVAGTHITRHSLAGTWSFVALLDADATVRGEISCELR